MSSLRDIRKRIQSTESVKQITKAMEMVSAARLRQAQERAKSSRPFADKLKEMLSHLADGDETHALFEARDVKKIAVIIIAGDKGLCGGYNTHVFKEADSFLMKHKDKKPELILIGAKTIDYYEKEPWTIGYRYEKQQGFMTAQKMKEIAEFCSDRFEKGEVDEVWMIYTHYVNAATRKVVVEKFLNIDRTALDGKKEIINYIYEPSSQEILQKIIPLYCISIIQKAVHDAVASELSARVQEMRAATKNAEEVIEDLTLLRNKVRQEAITKEILEITSGAEGVN